ncbi:BofC C-terminal domain-containing protein [Paenibacillus sp. S150]|uniref:BofC C-terminal domain-containing protein n=1 Tax=Paenibacillus sp. S150 TaxID=2749826 RepID=UPI001C593AE2|nr:BofC C-terminal domain-containing protein [Paenibacillus sp. S150]MBW4080251.1 BofC C-terminal domain-containing protein [Paenibacillus sp. S150]
MNAFRLKKQLWRRWRRWKKAPWVGAACIALTVLAWRGMQVPEEISGLLNDSAWAVPDSLDRLQNGNAGESVPAAAAVYSHAEENDSEAAPVMGSEQLLEAVRAEPISRIVHLKTTYLSGEEIVTLPGSRSIIQLKEVIVNHPDWNGWISTDGDLWLEHSVNDLSPLIKKDAFIGVDEHGNLTLFKGPPAGEKVLKTFFQMDMGSMKSSLPEDILDQLHAGIRVQDVEEYNSVLSTFSDYARDSSEQVMQSEE